MTSSPSSVGDSRILAASTSRLGTPAQVLRAVLIGCAAAALFGSQPMQRWTEKLDDSQLATSLQQAATDWNDALATVGASRPYKSIRAAVRAFEAKRF